VICVNLYTDHISTQWQPASMISFIDDIKTNLVPFLDLEGSRLLHSVTRGGDDFVSVVDYISNAHIHSINAEEETLLHRAVKNGIGQRDAQKIVERNPQSVKQVDHCGNTALHQAVMFYARNETLAYLIKANPESVNTGNNEGFSPLHLIVRAHLYHMQFERKLNISSLPVFRRQVSTDSCFRQNTITKLDSFLQCRPDNYKKGLTVWFSMYDTLQFILDYHPLSFSTRDKNGNTVLHYCARFLEFDGIYMQIPSRCSACCEEVNAKGRTVLDMLVYAISEDKLENDQYSTAMCMPEAHSHCLTTPENVILLSKNILVVCPALLHGRFLRDFQSGSWETIFGACKECDGMAYFLVRMCADLLFEENSSGEMPFVNMMFCVMAPQHNDYSEMNKSALLANKPAIIHAYLEQAERMDNLYQPRLKMRCSPRLESLAVVGS